MNNKVYKAVKWLLVIVVLVLSALLIYHVVRIKMIPNKYIIIISAILVLVNLVNILFTKSKKILLNIVAFIIGIFMISGAGLGIYYTNGTYVGLKNIVNNLLQENEYYIVTLKKSTYNKVSKLDDTTMGVLDDNKDRVVSSVDKLADVAYKDFTAPGVMYIDLVTEEIQSMVISNSVYEVLSDEYSDFKDKVNIIKTFTLDGEVEDTIEDSQLSIDDPFVIYISGQDINGAVTKSSRSDVNMLAVVNPRTKHVLLVNTPRDYYVQLNGRPGLRDKLTHAGIYGVMESANTLEDLYGIKIDAYVKVCYSTLEIIVDEIGGVDVYSDISFKSTHMKTWTVNKGMNHMDGKQAVAYSRERYAYASGDRHRGENQQAVLTAIINKVSQNKSYLLRYTEVLKKLDKYIYTNVSMDDIQALVKDQLNHLSKWNVESISVDGTGASEYTYSIPNAKAYVMVPDETSINNAKEKIKEIVGEN